MPEVVQRLVCHPTCEGAVTYHGYDVTPAVLRVVLALEAQRHCYAVRVAECGRGVGVLDPVVNGLCPRRIARKTMLLPELTEPLAPAGHELVDIGLVAGVEQQHVARGIEDPVQRQREFHDA